MLIRTTQLSLCCLASVAIMATSTMAQDEEQTPTENPVGYFMGVSVGQSLSQQGFQDGDFDYDAFANGIADALAGKEPNMTQEQLAQTGQKIQAMLQQRQQQKAAETEQAAAANQQKAKQWLAQNAQKENVKTLEGGVQYTVVEEGEGASPSASDTVKVHYTGRLTNGEVFDSSVERGKPATFQVGQVIKGWQQALQQMKVGGKWQLYIPPELAYGQRGAPPKIGPNEVLVFEVELLDIVE